MKSLDCFV